MYLCKNLSAKHVLRINFFFLNFPLAYLVLLHHENDEAISLGVRIYNVYVTKLFCNLDREVGISNYWDRPLMNTRVHCSTSPYSTVPALPHYLLFIAKLNYLFQ